MSFLFSKFYFAFFHRLSLRLLSLLVILSNIPVKFLKKKEKRKKINTKIYFN